MLRGVCARGAVCMCALTPWLVCSCVWCVPVVWLVYHGQGRGCGRECGLCRFACVCVWVSPWGGQRQGQGRPSDQPGSA